MNRLSYQRRSPLTRVFSGVGGFVLAICGLVLAVLLFLRLVVPGFFYMIWSPIWASGERLGRVTRTVTETQSRTELIADRENLEATNAGLVAENAALAARVADLTATLGTRVAPERGIVASVIARPPVAPYDVLILDQGSSAGVESGVRVQGAGGTPIGVIGEVENTRSRVTLYSSRTMRTEGWVGANRIPITIVGTGAGTFTATIESTAGVQVGDGVYVAMDGAFPLGTVAAIEQNPSSPTVQIDVRPYINPFSTTWVTVAVE